MITCNFSGRLVQNVNWTNRPGSRIKVDRPRYKYLLIHLQSMARCGHDPYTGKILLETFENWTKTLDEGYGLDVVYLDYRKAFDSVPHRRLIEKLKSFGIDGKLLQWLDDFLTSRTMKVGLRGTFSQLLEVLSGVPHSVLGPLLFLLYVNELPSWIKCDMKMFADDTKLWCRIKTDAESVVLQADLDSLQSWSDTWQLKFNADKCKVMHIGHSFQTNITWAKIPQEKNWSRCTRRESWV